MGVSLIKLVNLQHRTFYHQINQRKEPEAKDVLEVTSNPRTGVRAINTHGLIAIYCWNIQYPAHACPNKPHMTKQPEQTL